MPDRPPMTPRPEDGAMRPLTPAGQRPTQPPPKPGDLSPTIDYRSALSTLVSALVIVAEELEAGITDRRDIAAHAETAASYGKSVLEGRPISVTLAKDPHRPELGWHIAQPYRMPRTWLGRMWSRVTGR